MSGYAYDTSTTAYSVLAHAGLSVVDLDPYAGLSFSFVAESYAAFSSSVSVRLELLATYAGLSFILETANTFVVEKVVGETSNGKLSGFNRALFFVILTTIISDVNTKQAIVINPAEITIPPITVDKTSVGEGTVLVLIKSDDSTTALVTLRKSIEWLLLSEI